MIIKVGKATGLQERTLINSKLDAHAGDQGAKKLYKCLGMYLSVVVFICLISGAGSFAGNNSEVPGNADSDSTEVQNLRMSGINLTRTDIFSCSRRVFQ